MAAIFSTSIVGYSNPHQIKVVKNDVLATSSTINIVYIVQCDNLGIEITLTSDINKQMKYSYTATYKLSQCNPTQPILT